MLCTNGQEVIETLFDAVYQYAGAFRLASSTGSSFLVDGGFLLLTLKICISVKLPIVVLFMIQGSNTEKSRRLVGQSSKLYR